jgi:hypothetical protein
MGQPLVEVQRASRGDLQVSITADRGRITVHSRGFPYPLSLDPAAARALAGELTKHAIFLETEGDRVLGVAPDGSSGRA